MIPRVIPALLLEGDRLVKTRQFSDPSYIGDPINVINIFNSFEVDEILLLDIAATPKEASPQFALLSEVASECFIPLGYGGGLASVDDVARVLSIGFEKVVLNSAVPRKPGLVTAVAERFGSQAVIVSVDARRQSDGWSVFTEGGQTGIRREPEEYSAWVAGLGAGEILVTAIERDGTMAGYDLDLIERVADAVEVPVIASGGAGSRTQLADPVGVGASAVAAGSLFVYSAPGGGVLINFPSASQLRSVFENIEDHRYG